MSTTSIPNKEFVFNEESIIIVERGQRFRNASFFTPDIKYMFFFQVTLRSRVPPYI